jgi:choice-of-anchor C domain-containing protein
MVVRNPQVAPMKRLAIGLIVLAVSCSLNAAPALKPERSTNLLVNGSFEEGPKFQVHKALNPDSKEITGWVVTRGQIDVVEEHGGTWKAADGNRSLDLHGSPGHGGVKQSFATRPGRKYRVTFAFSGNPGVAHEKVQLAVEAAGKLKEFECSMAGKSNEDLKWEKVSWEFTAVDKTTVLELRTAMPPTSNGFGGPAIDDVKVVEVD